MAHGKETPRQKMIGMMYLVLTAMLALNVSKEAVEAFKKVDASLTKTIANYITKNAMTYAAFNAAAEENEEKAGKWKDKAFEVKQGADNIFDYIQDLKVEIITTAEGPESEALLLNNQIDIHKVKKIDENNIPSEILIGADQAGKANELRAMLADYRNFLVETLDGKDPAAEQSVLAILNTDNPKNLEGKEEQWANATFQTLPLVAVITILSKMQVDVRNAETDVLNFLYTQIDASSFRFNRVVPMVIPNSTYIMQGNEYEAQVFLAATDTTKNPEIFIGNFTTTRNADGTTSYEMTGDYQTLTVDQSGIGTYRVRPGSIGEKSWGGLVRFKSPDGSTVSYPIKQQKYSVGLPNVVVSPTAMNVLYQGIDNPMDISVPGVGSDKITVRMTNGEIKKGKYRNYRGEWVAQPRTVGENAQIIVSANIDGKVQSFPAVEFRVRRIPDPEARFANMKEGNVQRSVAAAQQVVTAVLENFEFDLQYNITGFTVSVNDKGFEITAESNNNRLTERQKSLIGGLRAGQKLIIEKITAVGPDGRTRNLNPIILKIN